MAIDNYYKDRKHNHQVQLFLKSLDLKMYDLDKHPCFDDLKLLQDIKRDLWCWLSQKEKDYWHYYWFLVYTDKKRLNRKAFRRLDKFVENVIYRQTTRQEQVNKIKAIRI
jgi:hypothetical protein